MMILKAILCLIVFVDVCHGIITNFTAVERSGKLDGALLGNLFQQENDFLEELFGGVAFHSTFNDSLVAPIYYIESIRNRCDVDVEGLDQDVIVVLSMKGCKASMIDTLLKIQRTKHVLAVFLATLNCVPSNHEEDVLCGVFAEHPLTNYLEVVGVESGDPGLTIPVFTISRRATNKIKSYLPNLHVRVLYEIPRSEKAKVVLYRTATAQEDPFLETNTIFPYLLPHVDFDVHMRVLDGTNIRLEDDVRVPPVNCVSAFEANAKCAEWCTNKGRYCHESSDLTQGYHIVQENLRLQCATQQITDPSMWLKWFKLARYSATHCHQEEFSEICALEAHLDAGLNFTITEACVIGSNGFHPLNGLPNPRLAEMMIDMDNLEGRLGVFKSPTLIVNDRVIGHERSWANFLSAICAGLNTMPDFCHGLNMPNSCTRLRPDPVVQFEFPNNISEPYPCSPPDVIITTDLSTVDKVLIGLLLIFAVVFMVYLACFHLPCFKSCVRAIDRSKTSIEYEDGDIIVEEQQPARSSKRSSNISNGAAAGTTTTIELSQT